MYELEANKLVNNHLPADQWQVRSASSQSGGEPQHKTLSPYYAVTEKRSLITKNKSFLA